jgi:hypothetical protein
MEEKTYRFWDIAIKCITVLALVVSAWVGWFQYTGLREREFKQAFYEQQIATIQSVFSTLSSIDNAQSPTEQKVAVEKFWMIYQGSGRTFLAPEMFEALKPVVNYINGCISKIDKHPVFPCSTFTASMSASHFARVARTELSLGWNLSFKQIGKEDPWQTPMQ